MKVAVTGAGGRTGSLCMKLLAQSPEFAPPRGLVRSEKSAAKVKKLLGAESDADCVIGDVSDATSCRALCEGCDGLVILTSAVPKPKIASLVVAIVSKILPWMDAKRPEFYFPDEGRPELVDWAYQKNQIDAAQGGVKKVVLVSSMGGTQIDNFLNTMGDGNILLWKRKAEMYLKASGLDYAIVHPGGLLDKEGGKRAAARDRRLAAERRSAIGAPRGRRARRRSVPHAGGGEERQLRPGEQGGRGGIGRDDGRRRDAREPAWGVRLLDADGLPVPLPDAFDRDAAGGERLRLVTRGVNTSSSFTLGTKSTQIPSRGGRVRRG